MVKKNPAFAASMQLFDISRKYMKVIKADKMSFQ